LINALVGRRTLAHISKTPGKTRTCNVYNVGNRFYLVDLPGYGYARASHAERRRLLELLHAYLAGRSRLRGVVWLLDVRRDPARDDLAMGDLLAARGVPVLIAITKGDKLPRARRAQRRRTIRDAVGVPEDQIVLTSSRTREGIDDLRESIASLMAPAARR
jgi:GTP-binding protein